MALSSSQIAYFKKRLEDLQKKMTSLLRGTTADVKSPDEGKGYSQHQADEGTDDFNRTITIEVTDKEVEILRQIERALEKIDDHSYGVCDLTGEEIPLPRLEAVPYATMTVKAQEKREKGLL